MSGKQYVGDFDKLITVTHTQVASTDEIDIDLGYIGMVRSFKITRSSGSGNFEPKVYDDAARTSLVFGPGVQSDTPYEEITPWIYVDSSETNTMFMELIATAGDEFTIEIKVIRFS